MTPEQIRAEATERIARAEELDTFAVGAIVRMETGRVALKVDTWSLPDRHGYVSEWAVADPESDVGCGTVGTDELDDLPATVLWEPTS